MFKGTFVLSIIMSSFGLFSAKNSPEIVSVIIFRTSQKLYDS